ncbi:MAG: lipopolysaccharide export system protein LptA [Hyphomicrobiales bacterium]|jgi:lipopolysaccharide export system protein LptA|nr:lipopolysaccharide export system protein LptA [Hyphomicrobiales bacterium]
MSQRFLVLLASLALTVAAGAQPAQQPAQQSGSAMQGIQLNRDQPVKIESDALEVRDKQRQATFMGNVKLVQGETILQCKTLVIFYEDTSAAPAAAPKKGAPATAQKQGVGTGTGQQIKRAEAKGDVRVTQKDQTATGDNGVFDVKSNNVTLTGNVVVTQGTNVLRGDRMVVNLDTGVARVESDKAKRVEGLFNPSTAPQPAATPAKDAKPAPAPAPPPAAKSAPGAPTRIN